MTPIIRSLEELERFAAEVACDQCAREAELVARLFATRPVTFGPGLDFTCSHQEGQMQEQSA